MEEIKIKKSIWLYIKNRLRYPFIKNKLSESTLPNLYFGYTDHPLDIKGTPAANIFNVISKIFRKKSKFILEIKLKKQINNSFIFSAKAYNVSIISIDLKSSLDGKIVLKNKNKNKECTLQIDFLKEDIYRVRLAEGEAILENRTPMIVKDIQDHAIKVSLEETDEKYSIFTTKLKLNVFKDPFKIEIYDSHDNLITESSGQTKNRFPNTMDSYPMGFMKDKKNKSWFGVESFVIYPGEAIYGLGEQFGPLNKIGQTIGLWNFEGLGNTSGRIYKNIPFFISTRGYGVFINETKPITFWVGSKEYCKNQIAIEGKLIDYFFFSGDFKKILNNYTELTGKAAVPPKWSFGVWMSRISYKSQEEVMKVAKKLREMKFPTDIIHIDTFWFKEDWKCNWEFNEETFPDPKNMFMQLKEMGFRVSLWQEPYVIKGTDVYKDAKKKGVLAKNNCPFVFLFLFSATPIDFSNPEGVSWYQERLKALFDLGASVIKADFGEAIEPAMKFRNYDGREMHNLYPLLYNKAAFEITKQTSGDGIIWARSAYAGSQRYPVHWSGDNSSTFENMLCSLRGGLSIGLCGFTFWSQDTGGFVGVPTDDLYIRWTQLSIFQSHIRYHGMGPRYREPWNYEQKTQEIVRNYLNFRYQLIPYLFTEAQLAAQQGLPMLSPLVIEYQTDHNVFNIEDQFLCGRNLLIAPILTKNNSRNIYIPKGIWYDYWTDEKIIGPRWINRICKIEHIPIFNKAGTILPLGPEVQCTDELTDDWLILKIFPDDNGNASYTIIDNDNKININAKLEEDSLKITINPRPIHLKIEIVKSIDISNIHINGELMD